MKIYFKICSIMLLAFGTEFSYGQEHTCVLPSLPSNSNSQKTSSGIEDGAEKRFPVNGSINALIVFVQHQNDSYEHCGKFEGYNPENNGKPLLPGATYTTYCANRSNDGRKLGSIMLFCKV